MALQGIPAMRWKQVVLIPAYKESAQFLTRFIQQFSNTKVLLIVVINQPESDHQQQPQYALWQQVIASGERVWQNQNLNLIKSTDSQVDILAVNRFTLGQRIPVKQGVGLARKIGADLAAWLISNEYVARPQIYSTDADALLPDNYITDSTLSKNTVAGVFDFRHVSDGNIDIDKATQLYEKRLHYYVEGLAYAGSIYAYHTIGSCLTFSLSGYCQVRGFPKRSGGEDFYLLNKLAKLGEMGETVKVQQLSPCIQLKARISDRVPFGTGPAVADIIAQQLQDETYLVYHPQSFVRLKSLLLAFQHLCLEGINIETFAETLDPVSNVFLQKSGFFQQFEKWCKQYKGDGLLLTIHHWFDAFRTLKFIHFQRDNDLPDVSLSIAKQIQRSFWEQKHLSPNDLS